MTKNPLTRRSFLGNLSKAGLLGTIGLAPIAAKAMLPGQSQDTDAPLADEHAFLCKPYLQCPTANTMTIMWLTSRPCYSWVEYGENGQLDKKAHLVSHGIVTAYNRLHKIQLEGLLPGKKYSYKVCSKDIVDFQPYKLTYGNTIESEVYSFTTPDPNSREVSWVIMNDIHDRPASIPHLMGLNGQDPYDFVFFNGDIFDYQSDEKQIIDHMLTACGDTFSTQIPFMYVRGNHETRGKFRQEWHNYFDNPGHNNFFSFTHGPVHAIVIDTGEDKEDTAPVYAGIVDFDTYREQQAQWLEQQMQTKAFKKAKFRVVMMHIPHYHSDDWHGTVHCRKLFGPLFDKYKIDLLVCGHTHKYGVYAPEAGKHSYPLIIGGGPTEGKRTLIKIKADQKELALTMLRDDGVKVGEYKVNTKRG